MSIINDALKKARQKRDRNIREPKKPLRTFSTEEERHREKTKTGIPKYGIQKTGGLSGSKKLILRHILFTIGAIVLISFVLLIMVRQNINYTVNRSLAVQEKDEVPAEPSKITHPQTSVEDSGPMLVEDSIQKSLEPAEFVITGIVSDEDSPMAIINGKVYMVGDRVKTAKVLEISEDMVVLEKDGERLELKVRYR